jgi:hypothetical protein
MIAYIALACSLLSLAICAGCAYPILVWMYGGRSAREKAGLGHLP